MNNIIDNLLLSIIEEYGDMIYRLAFHYVKNSADAEDIVQEVLLTYLIHSHSGKTKNAGWFVKVTKNKSLNLIKKRKRIIYNSADIPSMSEFPFDNGLFEALQALSPLDREIVYLFYQVGYSSKEIGSLVRKSDIAVRKRLERAKNQLKKYLEGI